MPFWNFAPTLNWQGVAGTTKMERWSLVSILCCPVEENDPKTWHAAHWKIIAGRLKSFGNVGVMDEIEQLAAALVRLSGRFFWTEQCCPLGLQHVQALYLITIYTKCIVGCLATLWVLRTVAYCDQSAPTDTLSPPFSTWFAVDTGSDAVSSLWSAIWKRPVVSFDVLIHFQSGSTLEAYERLRIFGRKVIRMSIRFSHFPWTPLVPLLTALHGNDLAFCVLAGTLDASQICNTEREYESKEGVHWKQPCPMMDLA